MSNPIVWIAAYGALLGTVNLIAVLVFAARSRRAELVEEIGRLKESVAYIRGRIDVR